MATDEEAEKGFCIYEYVNATMVEGGVFATPKLVKSLRPCANSITETATFPPLSGTAPYLGRLKRHVLKVHLEGWRGLPRRWEEWFKSLASKRATATAWKQASIFNALLSSLYHIPRKQDLVVGLTEYWCPQTNTFVFPWGEATITLEDVMVLGGFSVLGEPASLPLSCDDLVEVRNKLVERSERIVSKRTEQLSWIEFFMDEEQDHELQHVAFLSMWLSRFVFPFFDPACAIDEGIFSIAIHLSHGTRLALAPAVLAGIYHHLGVLKEKMYTAVVGVCDEAVMGLFRLVHLWAIERFSVLAPGSPKRLSRREPMVARWHGLELHACASFTEFTLRTGESFQWRPFVADLGKWQSHYKDNDVVVLDGTNSEEELSFGVCLCACMLEGVLGHSNQKYMPHRVARQFGMDQHFPGEFAVMKPTCMDKFSFYIPARSYKPAASLEYLHWWLQSRLEYETRASEAARRLL